MDGDTTQPASEATRLAAKSKAAFEDAVDAETPTEQAAKLTTARVAAGDSAPAGAYTFLQKLVGVIAVSLPFVLAIGNVLLGGDELEGSISHHYYTPMGNVFVGAMCALGVFFLSYQHKPLPGYRLDNRVSYGAAAAAIGVALFPTAEHEATSWTGEWYVSTAHLISACCCSCCSRSSPSTSSARPTRSSRRPPTSSGATSCTPCAGGRSSRPSSSSSSATSSNHPTPGRSCSGWSRSAWSRSGLLARQERHLRTARRRGAGDGRDA